jgi:hypothetical protein
VSAQTFKERRRFEDGSRSTDRRFKTQQKKRFEDDAEVLLELLKSSAKDAMYSEKRVFNFGE